MNPSGEDIPSGETDKTNKTSFKESITDKWTFVPPDWKDATNYPDPKKMSDPQWGWELLRRNHEFCEDVKTLLNFLGDDLNKIVDWHIRKKQEEFKRVYFGDSWNLPMIKLEEVKGVYSVHSANIPKELRAFYDKWKIIPFPFLTQYSSNSSSVSLDEWEIRYLIQDIHRPPLLSQEHPFRPTFFPVTSVRFEDEFCMGLDAIDGIYYGELALDVPWEKDSGKVKVRFPEQVAFAFDLRKGWDSQGKQAREIFQKIQDHLKKLEVLKERKFPYDKFPHYLRVLDAIAWKESLPKSERRYFTYVDIYRGIHGLDRHSKKDEPAFRTAITEALKVARQWRDFDFRLLFAS